MNKWIKVFVLSLLPTLFCFFTIANGNRIFNANIERFLDSGQEQFHELILAELASSNSSSENAVEHLNKFPVPKNKNEKNWEGLLLKSSGHFRDLESTSNKNLLIKFLIQVRKSDSIFPFHFFW